jgi:hypothetical protein
MTLYVELSSNQSVLLEQLKTTDFKTVIIKKKNSIIDTCNHKVIEFNNDINEITNITSNDYLLSFSKLIHKNTNNIGIVNDADFFLNKGYITRLNVIFSTNEMYTKIFQLEYKDKKVFNLKDDLLNVLENLLVKEFIHIIIQLYKIDDKGRLGEIIQAIESNLNNPYVAKIHCLLETEDVIVPTQIKNNKKYVEFMLGKWFTYKDAFDYANRVLENKYCCILNLDISLDSDTTWNDIINDLDNKKIYALSRHEFNEQTNSYELDNNFKQLLHSHTQDAWLFKTPINVENCDFEIGLLGCDNAIADRLYRSKYIVINRPLKYKIYHHDRTRGKNTNNFKQFHKETKGNKINKAPEKEGYRLLPNYDEIMNCNLDQLLTQFKISEYEKYDLICNIFSKKIVVDNS